MCLFLLILWSPAIQPPWADRGTGEGGRSLSLGVELRSVFTWLSKGIGFGFGFGFGFTTVKWKPLYKLTFKQDLKEIREWGLFTEREGLMQMEDTISKFFGPSSFSFYRTYFWQNNKKPSQNSERLLFLSWIKSIDSTIHSLMYC